MESRKAANSTGYGDRVGASGRHRRPVAGTLSSNIDVKARGPARVDAYDLPVRLADEGHEVSAERGALRADDGQRESCSHGSINGIPAISKSLASHGSCEWVRTSDGEPHPMMLARVMCLRRVHLPHVGLIVCSQVSVISVIYSLFLQVLAFPADSQTSVAEPISFRAKGSVQGRHLPSHLRQGEAGTAGECCNLLFDFSIHQADMVIPPFVQQDLQYLAC